MIVAILAIVAMALAVASMVVTTVSLISGRRAARARTGTEAGS